MTTCPNSTDIIDTWAPVSHNMSHSQSSSKHFTIHFFPTRPMTLACSFGVKWLTQAESTKSLDLLVLVSERWLIAWHNTLCSDQCPFWNCAEQYHTLWQRLHLLSCPCSTPILQQLLHWWDFGGFTTVSRLAEAVDSCLTASCILLQNECRSHT